MIWNSDFNLTPIMDENSMNTCHIYTYINFLQDYDNPLDNDILLILIGILIRYILYYSVFNIIILCCILLWLTYFEVPMLYFANSCGGYIILFSGNLESYENR